MKNTIAIAIAAALVAAVSLVGHNTSVVRAQGPPATIPWSNSELTADQNGSIELGSPDSGTNPTQGAMPHIDFHYGNGFNQDYNTRLINNSDGDLEVDALHPNNGSAVVALQVSSSDTIVYNGVGQGTGLKHARGAGCSGNGTCSVTVTWPGIAFANTNYTASCTSRGADLGNALTITGKTNSTVTVKLSVPQVIGVSMTGVDCIAMHD